MTGILSESGVEEQRGAVSSGAGRAPFAAQGTGAHVGLKVQLPALRASQGCCNCTEHTEPCWLSCCTRGDGSSRGQRCWVWSVSLLPVQSPLEVKHRTAWPGGAQPLLLPVCVPAQGRISSYLCHLWWQTPCTFCIPILLSLFFLFLLSFPWVFFLLGNTLTYYFLKHLIFLPLVWPVNLFQHFFHCFVGDLLLLC